MERTVPILIKDLGMLHSSKGGSCLRRYGLFRCTFNNCGNEFKAIISAVKSGHISSCVCYRKYKTILRVRKHKLTTDRIHNRWRQMRRRCYDKNSISYKKYGGAGVTVCSEWNNDFLSFLKWSE